MSAPMCRFVEFEQSVWLSCSQFLISSFRFTFFAACEGEKRKYRTPTYECRRRKNYYVCMYWPEAQRFNRTLIWKSTPSNHTLFFGPKIFEKVWNSVFLKFSFSLRKRYANTRDYLKQKWKYPIFFSSVYLSFSLCRYVPLILHEAYSQWWLCPKHAAMNI